MDGQLVGKPVLCGKRVFISGEAKGGEIMQGVGTIPGPGSGVIVNTGSEKASFYRPGTVST
jgi:hypothetical protein